MQRLLVTLLAIGSFAALPTVPASADMAVVRHPFSGTDGCSLDAATSPSGPTGTLVGQLYGGPVSIPGPSGSSQRGYLTCSVQVNASRHSDPDVVSATGPTTTGTVALAPTVRTFAAGPDDYVYLCSQVDVVGGGTYYLQEPPDPTIDREVWTTSADSDCSLAVSATTPDAVPVAMCLPPRVSGNVTYDEAPPTATSGPTSWTMSIEADCVGTSPLAGHYSLTFKASGNGSCLTGSGSADVSGTGPNGSLSGTWSYASWAAFQEGGPVWGGNGSFTDATGTYSLSWLVQLDLAACPQSGDSVPVQRAWGFLNLP